MPRLAPLVLASLACAMACSRTAKPRGQLMIAIDTDTTPGVDFDRLEIQVVRPKLPGSDNFDKVYTEIGKPNLVTFPATLAIVANDDPSTQILIRVLIGDGNKKVTPPDVQPAVGYPITIYEALTTVPAEGVALLRIHIEWLCYDKFKRNPDGYVEGGCDDNFTCRGGECVDWTVDSSKLPAYDPAIVFGGGGPEGNGDCFDTVGCFARGAMVPVDLASCTFPSPAKGTGLNVAIVLPKHADGTGPGICGNDACYAPLFSAKDFGWTESAGTISLPKETCKRIKSGAAIGVAATTVCLTRTEVAPTCGPWSSVHTEAGNFDAGAPDGFVAPDAPSDSADAG